jgi:sphingomyelin phosphodiesterase acid-like 3
MNCKLLRGLVLGLCLLTLVCGSHALGREGAFLVISDLHFNPFYDLDAGQFSELSRTPVDDWPSFFERLQQPVVRLETDTNYALLASALEAAARGIERPDFILCPGDIMAHSWQQKYCALAPESIAINPQAYRDFTAKSLQFVAREFRKRFPSAVVLPALGNDDAFCQDYWIQPNDAFLQRFDEAWKPLMGTAVDRAAFGRSFSSLGCYVADLPGLTNHRLIVLNSVLWSTSYCTARHDPGANNCCGCTNPGAAPGAAEFDWLENALRQAAEERKTVWLLMHIPPGLHSYKKAGASGKSAAAGFWTEDAVARYVNLVDRYRSILQIAFTGHTHRDDFRIVRIDGQPALLHKIVPAVSPITGNNPAFQTFRYDTETGALTNWQTHFLGLALAGRSQPAPTWSMEYDAREVYQLSPFNAQTVAALFDRIQASPTGREAGDYRTSYAVSARSIPEVDLAIYTCAVLNTTYSDYRACMSGRNIPLPVQTNNADVLRREADGLAAPKP